MSTATPDAACWPDLPLDLLRDISRHLHAATDYVRFLAVCKSWRDTLPPPACRPAFLPWLLARRDDDTGHRKAHCVFSSRSSRCNGLYIWDREWAIAVDDGVAACCLFTAATCPDDEHEPNDPIAGSATSVDALPPYPDEIKSWVKRASGTVSGDGTVFVYALGLVEATTDYVPIFTALLRPGDAAWTLVKRDDLCFPTSCVAYHDGKIVMCCTGPWWPNCWGIVPTDEVDDGGVWSGRIDCNEAEDKKVQSSYLVESRGELLWVFVHYYKDDHSSLLDELAVSEVYALRYEGGEPQWVRRDCRSFADRVLFLGRQGSFAVDASRFGGIGGCAYFIDRRRRSLHSGRGVWSKSPLKRCRVYKYSFLDHRSELVEQLPAKWNDFRCMWFTPKPDIASTEEIGEKLKPSQVKSCFTFYVGNLPRKVDSCRLRQFFSKHGKVADARVVVDTKTRRSRGFGFVTVENNAAVDDEPAAHAVFNFHGQCLDGRPLVVKIADQLVIDFLMPSYR